MLQILLFASLALAQTPNKIDPRLSSFMSGETSQKVVRVQCLMKMPQDLDQFDPNLKYQSQAVLEFLRTRTKKALAPIYSNLTSSHQLNNTVVFHRIHEITNGFSADVTREGLAYLAQQEGIERILLNTSAPVPVPPPPQAPQPTRDPGYYIRNTQLDRLVKEAPAVTGRGVVVGVLDTGVDASHPALRGKVLKFFNGQTKQISEPVDFERHGTHVSGLIVGGDRVNLNLGVAPGARLVVAGAALFDYDTILEGMRFLMDPDSDPRTPDFPRVVNNSWNCKPTQDEKPDKELFYRAISAWEAAGILTVFSAGNDGPNPMTIGPCHEHPLALIVANVGATNFIALKSSRGPARFRGALIKKPDLAAPGENLVSSAPGDTYEIRSGTSQAAPIVSGAAALMLQVNPKLTPPQLRSLLIRSLNMWGQPAGGDDPADGRWSPEYGYGTLNVYRAVLMAIAAARENNPADFSSLFTGRNLFLQ